jgi:hypothetical protein
LATRHEATEHGSIIKFIDQLFLDTFGLASLNELYKEGRMEEVFSSVYSGGMGAGEGQASSDNALTGDIEGP